MIRFREDVLDFLGVTAWHKAGITGKGINVLEMESDNSHEDSVEAHLKAIAPDVNYINKSFGTHIINGDIVSGDFLDLAQFCRDNNIHIIGSSIGGHDTKDTSKILRVIKDMGILHNTSAGNTGERVKGFAKNDVAESIGALIYNPNLCKIQKKSYSSIGDELDFTIPTISTLEGTSFTAPIKSGMDALIQELCFIRHGTLLNQHQIHMFYIDNIYDLGMEGKDELYGHGVPILPLPKRVDFLKYLNEAAQRERNIVNMDVAATILGGRFCIPTRFIAQALGGDASWDKALQEGTFRVGNKIIKVRKGSKELIVEELKV